MSGPTLAVAHSRCVDALTAEHANAAAIAFHLIGAVPVVSLDGAIEASRSAARSAADLVLVATQGLRVIGATESEIGADSTIQTVLDALAPKP